MSHSREGESAKTGVEANIGFADGLEGELHDAVRNPVKQFPFMVSSSNHSLLFDEPFDKLRVNVSHWIPAFAGMTLHSTIVLCCICSALVQARALSRRG